MGVCRNRRPPKTRSVTVLRTVGRRLRSAGIGLEVHAGTVALSDSVPSCTPRGGGRPSRPDPFRTSLCGAPNLEDQRQKHQKHQYSPAVPDCSGREPVHYFMFAHLSARVPHNSARVPNNRADYGDVPQHGQGSAVSLGRFVERFDKVLCRLPRQSSCRAFLISSDG